MASGPITAWQIERAKMEVVTGFLFLGSKITADSECSHEIRQRLFLGRKAMTNLDSDLKSRDVTRPRKVCVVKTTVFPVEAGTARRQNAKELMPLNCGAREDS